MSSETVFGLRAVAGGFAGAAFSLTTTRPAASLGYFLSSGLVKRDIVGCGSLSASCVESDRSVM